MAMWNGSLSDKNPQKSTALQFPSARIAFYVFQLITLDLSPSPLLFWFTLNALIYLVEGSCFQQKKLLKLIVC